MKNQFTEIKLLRRYAQVLPRGFRNASLISSSPWKMFGTYGYNWFGNWSPNEHPWGNGLGGPQSPDNAYPVNLYYGLLPAVPENAVLNPSQMIDIGDNCINGVPMSGPITTFEGGSFIYLDITYDLLEFPFTTESFR
jgi:hypothetical protein